MNKIMEKLAELIEIVEGDEKDLAVQEDRKREALKRLRDEHKLGSKADAEKYLKSIEAQQEKRGNAIQKEFDDIKREYDW